MCIYIPIPIYDDCWVKGILNKQNQYTVSELLNWTVSSTFVFYIFYYSNARFQFFLSIKLEHYLEVCTHLTYYDKEFCLTMCTIAVKNISIIVNKWK